MNSDANTIKRILAEHGIAPSNRRLPSGAFCRTAPSRLSAPQWYGAGPHSKLTYKTLDGRVGSQLLARHDEPRLELVEAGRPWSFDGDGALFRLVSEATADSARAPV